MDINESEIQEIFNQYKKMKLEEMAGKAVLGKLSGSSSMDDMQRKLLMLSIAEKNKELGLDYDVDDASGSSNDAKAILLNDLLKKAPKYSPAQARLIPFIKEAHAVDFFDKVAPSTDNLSKIGISIGKEAKKNVYPYKRAASFLSVLGL